MVVKTVSLYIIILCGIGDLTHANPSVLFHFFGDSSIIPVVIGNRNGFRLVSFSIRKYRFNGRLLSTPSGTRCNRLFRKKKITQRERIELRVVTRKTYKSPFSAHYRMCQFGLGVLKVSPQPLSRPIVAYSGDTQKSPQVNCVCTGDHSV